MPLLIGFYLIGDLPNLSGLHKILANLLADQIDSIVAVVKI